MQQAVQVEEYGPAPTQKLAATTPQDGDQYGFAVAADNRWLVVGAKSTNVAHGLWCKSGVVHVYRRNRRSGDWNFYQTLVPPHPAGDGLGTPKQHPVPGGEFGESVALYKNRIAVGARFAMHATRIRSGVVYTYTWGGGKTGWVPEVILEPPGGRDDDEFGRSVALGPFSLAIGARFANSRQGADAGAVYLYRPGFRGGWKLEEKLVDPGGKPGDEFGRSLALDQAGGGRLVVGSRKADGASVQSAGTALVYRHAGKGWILEQVLSADDAAQGMYFGQSVALGRDVLVIGARNADSEADKKSGAAYVFRYDRAARQWVQEQKLFNSFGTIKAQYGFAVAIDCLRANRITVSARKAENTFGATGAVHVYSYDRLGGCWQELQEINGAYLSPGDDFGQSIAMDPVAGSWLVVGADQAAPEGAGKGGAAFCFAVEPWWNDSFSTQGGGR